MFTADEANRWTPRRTLALFGRVVAGDAAARKEMIVGNMPLAVAKVESFIRCFPEVAHLRDDLTSAAFIGLAKAVNQMAEGCRIKQPENWNPTDCIGAWINRELGRLIEIEAPIRVPQDQGPRLRKAEGRTDPRSRSFNVIPERFEVPSYEKELEMRDLIESCAAAPKSGPSLPCGRPGTPRRDRGSHRQAAYLHLRDGQEADARVQRKLRPCATNDPTHS